MAKRTPFSVSLPSAAVPPVSGADIPIFTTCTAFAIPGATTNEAAATPIESTTKQAFLFNMANLLIALGKYSFEYKRNRTLQMDPLPGCHLELQQRHRYTPI
ncbi:hypothetical protein [Paraburkholderia sp. MM5482-R2]|uniref:hypothetical protein n=1 Tax=Paraburkholderia sp. MM5482-R2 TaxID=2991064 RepID=UPI003D2464CE